jgi:hypothetical protein
MSLRGNTARKSLYFLEYAAAIVTYYMQREIIILPLLSSCIIQTGARI